MPYVVTQSCCADASCVIACPVNCIHPTPGEPGFATAEMLYVDPDSCVGCGACATACPVEAIKPHTKLSESELPFQAINAEYYDVFPHSDRRPLAVVAKQRRLERTGPFRVAVVGAGPAGLYTADELLRHPEITVDVYDRLPTPYGLVRAGVAPDHPHTKRVEKLFRQIEDQPGFRYFLGVDVGHDVSLAELRAQYHAVVYSVGAATDRPLGIEGEGLEGSVSATDVVGWYNGHPDKQDLALPLDTLPDHGRVVVVGNGNVALDVARILSRDPAGLAETDIAALPLTALTRSRVREVVVLGRRGPAEAAFTVPELVGLVGLCEEAGIDLVVDTGGVPIEPVDERTRILHTLAQREPADAARRIVLRFYAAPSRILGEHGRVVGLEVERTRLEAGDDGLARPVPTGEIDLVETGLVLRAVGYRGLPVTDLPHDALTGTVPNDHGRVEPGVYVAGWIKRGPTGFIGSNKSDAQETVTAILDDLDAGTTGGEVVGTPESIAAVVRGRRPGHLDRDGWRILDDEERRRGARTGRVRAKIVDVEEMLRVVEAAPRPESTRRYADRRRRFEKRG